MAAILSPYTLILAGLLVSGLTARTLPKSRWVEGAGPPHTPWWPSEEGTGPPHAPRQRLEEEEGSLHKPWPSQEEAGTPQVPLGPSQEEEGPLHTPLWPSEEGAGPPDLHWQPLPPDVNFTVDPPEAFCGVGHWRKRPRNLQELLYGKPLLTCLPRPYLRLPRRWTMANGSLVVPDGCHGRGDHGCLFNLAEAGCPARFILSMWITAHRMNFPW